MKERWYKRKEAGREGGREEKGVMGMGKKERGRENDDYHKLQFLN